VCPVGDELFWPLCIIIYFKFFPSGWGNKATISAPTLQSVEMSLSFERLIPVQDNCPSAHCLFHLTSFLKHQITKEECIYFLCREVL
jgi:hypothetical protein